MPASVASLVFVIGILGLFWLAREEKSQTSAALWIPIVWFLVGASRSFSSWLGATPVLANPDQYLEGSPLDSVMLTVVLAAGLVVLAMRARKSSAFLRENAPLIIFLAYCLFSVLWSDYPFVAFKRWTKALGNVVMVAIVLTDPKPSIAAKRFLTRTGFVLIPVSLLLIKYYPLFGRGYDPFTGEVRNLGVADNKNGLGCDCLVFGLASLWAILDVFQRSSPDKLKRFLGHGTILLMVLYLFHLANSMTAEACFAIGALILVFVRFFAKGNARPIHFLALAFACGALVLYFFPDSYSFVVHSLGRQTDLTGRTDIWQDVLRLDRNPLLGSGFESFFLGQRLHILWAKYWWHPQEAHDGYLETYLTLGWVGIGLLGMLIVTGYRNALRSFRDDPNLGALRLAFLFVALAYNFTEAALKVMHPIWIMFLFSVVAIPRASVPVPAAKPVRVPVRKRQIRPAYSTSTRSSA